MTIKIYHNPRCSKSRQTLELLRENGVEPQIIEYLKDTPRKDELQDIITLLGYDSARDLMRIKEADYKANNLGDKSLTESQLIEAMVQYPKIIERPIVIHGNKAVIGRPPENILAII